MHIDLSYLAISSTVEAILENTVISQSADRRLEAIGRDRDWLIFQGAKYQKAWEQDLDDPTCEEMALLLSWILCSHRSSDIASDLNLSIKTKMLRSVHNKTGSPDMPLKMQVGVVLGTLARPVAELDPLLPALLPGTLLNPESEAAYSGVLELVERQGSEEWTEIQRTSILWRLAGLAESLTNRQSKNLFETMTKMSFPLKDLIPNREKNIIESPWHTQFVSDRNTLTHIDSAFPSTSLKYGNQTDIFDHLRLATYFTALAINQKLLGLEPEDVERWLPAIENDVSWVQYQ